MQPLPCGNRQRELARQPSLDALAIQHFSRPDEKKKRGMEFNFLFLSVSLSSCVFSSSPSISLFPGRFRPPSYVKNRWDARVQRNRHRTNCSSPTDDLHIAFLLFLLFYTIFLVVFLVMYFLRLKKGKRGMSSFEQCFYLFLSPPPTFALWKVWMMRL